MSRSFAICCLMAGALLPAQTPPCFAVNDTSTSVGTALTPNLPSGPNVYAWRMVLSTPTGYGLRAMSIFTGNTQAQPGFMKLEIWHEGANGLPASRWTGGTWQISHALGNDWQGANTSWDIADVTWPVWVVWTEPGSSTEPFEPGGTTFPTAQLVNGVWTLLPVQTAPKLRFYCARLDGAHVAVPWYGPSGGCWGPSAGWGTLFTNQQPAVGNADFAVEGFGFLPGQPAFLVLGTSWGGPPPTTGCTLQHDRTVVLWGGTGTGDVRADALTTGASGHVTFPLPIPANPVLAGFPVSGQLVVGDPAALPLPFVVSNALQFVVF